MPNTGEKKPEEAKGKPNPFKQIGFEAEKKIGNMNDGG